MPDDLDLVERDDQITFELSLDDKVDREEALDVFKVDDDFEAHEAAWGEIKREILGDEDDDDGVIIIRFRITYYYEQGRRL